MAAAFPSPSPALIAAGRVRLRTLILLRWLAIAGQTAAILFVEFGLRLDLPLSLALWAIALSAWVNIFLMVARPEQGLATEWEAALQLAYDVLQLAFLLALTGGASNPFTLLFIAPVAVAAAALRTIYVLALTVLATACIIGLSLWRMPLPWIAGQTLVLPPLYEVGLSVAVVIGLIFTAVYAWRVAAEEERLNEALREAEGVLAREQRLSALGGLAAAAAHELGTPLATIHLVAKEMAREIPPDSPYAEDAALLVSQSERCRAILKQLSARPETGDAMVTRTPLMALLEEAAAPHQGLGAEIAFSRSGESPAPTVKRMPEIMHGLGNIIENAVGFASQSVDVRAEWSGAEIVVTVVDDGPGFPSDVLGRLGEPYVSERGGNDAGGGLGLGFFIAATLLERSGASVTFRNRTPPRAGAVVRVAWPRSVLEAEPL
ncbi:MAG: ActS/PrrB/RegB family redox-sensitive histidine kinase [Alphaproteobacteria bacterium]|nr:ActS/PrrB/RegB family redox-sensitive histidine kinase [Alphaproteobacteria bacterium]